MKNAMKLMLPHLTLGAFTLLSAQAAEEGFKPLFNGNDLSGWKGDPVIWTVKDGGIHGVTTSEQQLKNNTFLIYTNGPVQDFELRLLYRITPNNDKGFANSGIQYRSKVYDEAKWIVGGYQADFEAGTTYSGILYEEREPRGIMAARGEKVLWNAEGKKEVQGAVGKSEEIQAKIKQGDWNEYTIIAKGNHLIHKINGVTTIEVVDEDPKNSSKTGVLALQIHTGPPMTVEFKNIRIKELK